MTRPESTENLPVERTIRSSREFETSRELMWRVFKNPGLLASWWGPSGFTNRFESFDFRPGGLWLFTMHGPNGSEYFQNKIFVEIQEPRKIVLDHEDPVHGFRMFITLNESARGTTLEWILVFDTAEEAGKVRPFVEPANEENFDRLAEFLGALPAGQN